MKQQPDKDQIREYLISNTIDKLVHNIMEDTQCSLDEAMDKVYQSNVLKLLQIPEGELYVQSAEYVYEILEKEYSLH